MADEEVKKDAIPAAGVPEVAEVKSWGASTPSETLSADDKLWGMLANLLSIIFLIGPIVALVVKGQSKFVKFNALQMIFLSVAWMGLFIVLFIAHIILMFIPVIGWLFMILLSLLGACVGLAGLALLVFLALKANQGIVYRLPVIGGIAYKQAYGPTA